MFRHREDAAFRLARRLTAQHLKGRAFHDPLVLAAPRGGVVTGAVLAQELGAELDVVLVRKLRAPGQPELTVGALAESGRLYLTDRVADAPLLTSAYLAEEVRRQGEELARWRQQFRAIRPPASVTNRTVIVADDGIATGATVISALQTLWPQQPYELIVATPVAFWDALREVSHWCDETVCLLTPDRFTSVRQFYEDFTPIEDEQVVQLLRAFAPARSTVPDRRSP